MAAVSLSPDGIPVRSQKWKRVLGKATEEYAAFVSELVKRTPPECLTSRWYSIDVASFYYYGLWRLSLLEFIAPPNC